MPDPARMSFSSLLLRAPARLRPVCRALRAAVVRCAGRPVEIVWPRMGIASYGSGPRKMTDHYAYIGIQRAHVNLGFYRGASLRDPAGLLEGTGRRLRHVKVRSVREARSAAVAGLIREAVAERAGRRPGA